MKRRPLNRTLIEQLAHSYGGIGDKVRGLPSGLVLYDANERPRLMRAPAVLIRQRLHASDLKQLERRFPHPIQFFDDPYFDVKANLETLRSHGWREIKPSNIMNVWLRPVPLEIPRGIEIRIGNYFDPRFHSVFWSLMRANFKTDSKFKAELDGIHRRVEARVKGVILCNSKGRAIAAGLVATLNSSSYLYAGSILSANRGRGLWRLLVAARQAVSNSGEGHLWQTSTRNPRIMKKSDFYLRVRRFERTRYLMPDV